MNTFDSPQPLELNRLKPETFRIVNLDDEIRVDRLCTCLLKSLYAELSGRSGLAPEDAGRHCHGADYFLRDFIVANRRQNLLQVTSRQVRQFAAHWYIVNNLEPNMAELRMVLDGIVTLYRFLAGHGLVAADQAEKIAAACTDHAYYQQRIDDFWAIEGDGYIAWRDAEPL